jgi:small GTP-binding protein
MYDKNENENERFEIKVILIGNSGVGKTKLINRSIGLDFNNNDTSTVSGSFVSKVLTINKKEYIINIWDTAGEELYRGITQLFFRGSEIIILVYDICSSSTFESLERWYERCEEIIDNDHIYGIVGNKSDLYLNSQVNDIDAKKFAELKNAKFRLVSAKNDPQSFVDFVEELVKDYKNLAKNSRTNSIKIEKEKIGKNKEICHGCSSSEK